ncbi:MAG TPA: ABC transporter permease [Candidatus Acidoferrum sp.]|nr:ABC transporter permease [Candidatus Acidoferrum sp.]
MFWTRRKSGDFSAEIEAHLQQEYARLREEGLSEKEARAAARRAFGNVMRAQENFYERSHWMWWDHLKQDARFGLRILRKSPGFAAVVVLTLAMGIGANTAIFTLVEALYLKPLPVRDANELVRIYAQGPAGGYGAGFSGPEFELLRDHATSLAVISTETQIAQLHAQVQGSSEEIRGAFVSANYFQLLGVAPRLGRGFDPSEGAAPGRDAVAVISDEFWKAHFHADPGALGSEMRVNRVPFKVIGIAPPGFYGDIAGMPAQIWIPTPMLAACGYGCSDHSSRCSLHDAFVGRLAPQRSPANAESELRSLIVWSATDWPERPSRRRLVVASAVGVPPDERAEFGVQMRLLMAMTGALLLIACANLGGLLIARGIARRREIAVRLSMGASRSRIIRQLLTESLLLAALFGGFGLWLSVWARDLLSNYYATDSEGFHHRYDFALDWRVLAYAVTVAVLAGIFFGLLPAIRASRQDLVSELKQGGAASAPAGGRLGRGLVMAQVSLSMVLVVAAVLLVRSGLAVARGTNFDPRQMVVVRLRPELLQYPPQQVESLIRRVMEKLEATPGVQSAGFMEGGEGLVWRWANGHLRNVSLPGESQVNADSSLKVSGQDVNATFFATLRMPLLQGRAFAEQDNASAPRVAIVNETLARRLWPSGTAVGQTLLVDGAAFRVVGVVGDIQPASQVQPPAPHLYLSYWQSDATTNGDVRLAIRVDGQPERELPRIREVIQSVDPQVPLGEDMSMAEQLSLEYMPVLLSRRVMEFCGALGLILSAIGLYSILAFSVRSRTREIGVRMALGAQRVNVLGFVLRDGLKMALCGVVAGGGPALLATRLLATLLFGVTASDLVTYVAVAALLILVAMAACYLPARRAMRVDPMVALRHE